VHGRRGIRAVCAGGSVPLASGAGVHPALRDSLRRGTPDRPVHRRGSSLAGGGGGGLGGAGRGGGRRGARRGGPRGGGWGAFLLVGLVTVSWPRRDQPHAVATFGPPLGVLVLIIAAFSEVGLLGRALNEDEREWWARACAYLLIHALGWLVVFGACVY